MASVRQTGTVHRPLVFIIVLNWNGWDDTRRLLHSIDGLDYPDHRVVVVDNGSVDGSASKIRELRPSAVVLENGINLGYAGGANVGMRWAVDHGADLVWLLNNDTTVVPGALTSLVSLAEAVPGEFYGSWIMQADQPERLWWGGGRYSRWSGAIGSELSGLSLAAAPGRGEIRRTSWITGCSLLVRSATIRDLGLMDETYFAYFEELAWQLRSDGRLPRAHVVGLPLVYHRVGGSTGGAGSAVHTTFMTRNYLKLLHDHAGMAAPVWLMRWLYQYWIRPAVRGDWRSLRAALRGALAVRAPGEAVLRESSTTTSG